MKKGFRITWGEGYSQVEQTIAEAIKVFRELIKQYDVVIIERVK